MPIKNVLYMLFPKPP